MGSRSVVTEAEHATRQQAQYNRRNAARRSSSAKTDVASEWVHNGLDLIVAAAFDGSVTAADRTARCRRLLDGEIVKIGEEWSLSGCFADASRG